MQLTVRLFLFGGGTITVSAQIKPSAEALLSRKNKDQHDTDEKVSYQKTC